MQTIECGQAVWLNSRNGMSNRMNGMEWMDGWLHVCMYVSQCCSPGWLGWLHDDGDIEDVGMHACVVMQLFSSMRSVVRSFARSPSSLSVSPSVFPSVGYSLSLPRECSHTTIEARRSSTMCLLATAGPPPCHTGCCNATQQHNARHHGMVNEQHDACAHCRAHYLNKWEHITCPFENCGTSCRTYDLLGCPGCDTLLLG